MGVKDPVLTVVREGGRVSCLPGEITAWAGPRVPRVPVQVVQCRAELRSSLSCWSPPGCSSQGASGCGSGMGKRCRPGSPPWVTAADPPQSLRCTSSCTDVPWCSAPPHTGRASPGTQLGGNRQGSFLPVFLTPPHWGLSHTLDCCFRLRAVGKHVVKTGNVKIGNYLHFAARET